MEQTEEQVEIRVAGMPITVRGFNIILLAALSAVEHFRVEGA